MNAQSLINRAEKNQLLASVAQDILEDLGYGDMTVPVGSFNDDDFYLINPLTGEIKAQFGSKQKFVAESSVKPGLTLFKGMRAKHMGLWRLPARRSV